MLSIIVMRRHGGALAPRVARVENPARLDQHQLDLLFGVRLVLHALRHDEHFA
jgi:hypothetical protein